jgi:hypothetical protein
MKLWIMLVSGPSGLHHPDEFLLRVPSMLAVSLAGGFLAAAAWRAWGGITGLLLIPLWCLHALTGYFAVEARPYGFLLLMLALGIWSNARLWLEESQAEPLRRRALWIVSAASPVLAAALVPLGAVTVFAIELSIVRQQLPTGAATAFAQRWRVRSALVCALVLCVLAIYLPGLYQKSKDFWPEQYYPLSLQWVGNAIGTITLQSNNDQINGAPAVIIASLVLIVLAAVGSVVMRHDFLGRMALGLAVVFPITMVAFSMVRSLLVPRYFLPMLPGILHARRALQARHLQARLVRGDR